MTAKRIAVFISGRGSNMISLLDFSRTSEAGEMYNIVLVVSNRPSAEGLKVATSRNVRTFISKDEKEILKEVVHYKVDIICLAGFMKILSEDFIKNIGIPIINIHPSLLPSFKGLEAQKQALEAGVKIAGCTVHYVSPEVDAGEIILQGAVPVLENDDVSSLSKRILSMEHKCFPLALMAVLGKSLEHKYLIHGF